MFNHVPVDLGYQDLDATTTEKGRRYVIPDGQKLPSITTVLSILTEQSIREWRARVGEEEANRVSAKASSRGTKVHAIIEDYINNVEDYEQKYLPNVVGNFMDVKPILDERIGDVYAQEAPLYSTHLGVAGRVDCVAMFDGKLSIIDFKTARKPKRKEWIENYFIQESAYAVMWEERTGTPIVQLVTIIAVDNNPPQVFVEHRDNWTSKLVETINEYKRRKGT